MNKFIFLTIVLLIPYAGKSQSENVNNLPEIIRIIQIEFGQVSKGLIIDFVNSDKFNSEGANKLLELRETLRRQAEEGGINIQNQELKRSIKNYTSALIRNFSDFFSRETGETLIKEGTSIKEKVNEIDLAIGKLNALLSEECRKSLALPFSTLRKKIEYILGSAEKINELNQKILIFNQEKHSDKCTKIKETGILKDIKTNEKVIDSLDAYFADKEAIKNELMSQITYRCQGELLLAEESGDLKKIKSAHISPLFKKVEKIRDSSSAP